MAECSQPVRDAVWSPNSAVNQFDLAIVSDLVRMDGQEQATFAQGVTDFLVEVAINSENNACPQLFEAAQKVENLYSHVAVRRGGIVTFEFEHVDVVAQGVLRAFGQVYAQSDEDMLGAEASMMIRVGRNRALMKDGGTSFEKLDNCGLPNPDLEKWANLRSKVRFPSVDRAVQAV
mgnify:CR=1 FL=1